MRHLEIARRLIMTISFNVCTSTRFQHVSRGVRSLRPDLEDPAGRNISLRTLRRFFIASVYPPPLRPGSAGDGARVFAPAAPLPVSPGSSRVD